VCHCFGLKFVQHEGSYFEGGWNKGDKTKFLAVNEKGEKEGMFRWSVKVSIIFVSFSGVLFIV